MAYMGGGEWIFGSGQLADAINAATQRQISIRCAEDLLYRAWEHAGIEGVKSVASEYGVNYAVNNLGYPVLYSVEAMEGASATSAPVLYNTALEATADSAAHELVLTGAKQVTTQAGKTFLAGAAKTAAKALPVVGAVATGIGLGWESYQEHTDFWTDLSESIFNTDMSPDGPIEVLARASSGGYTTAVKEQEIAKIIQGLAENGCFDFYDYESLIDSDFPGGVIDATYTEVNAEGVACGLAYAKAQELMPGGKVLVVRPDTDVGNNKVQGSAWIFDPANLPATISVTKLSNPGSHTGYYYISSNIRCTTVHVQMDKDDPTQYNYIINQNDTYGITSGIRFVSTIKDDIEIGGLNVNKIAIEADNELFTNDHSGSSLILAPTAQLSDIITQLREKYPEWYESAIPMDEYNPETNEIEHNLYYPITIPWWDPLLTPDKDPSYDSNEAQKGDLYQKPDPRTDPQGKEATENNQKYNTDGPTAPTVPVPPATPTPSDPGAGAGGDVAEGLWAVYNPDTQELSDLGAYLWSSNIVDLLQKFLQNPMDAIITLHKIYCTPPTGPAQHIILGYLDSGVSSDVVTNQFVTVNCGSVTIPEFFGDARDYDNPYTTIEAYLPFIGIVKLRTADIVGGTVNVVYTVDLYSGACLCKIFVTKLGAKQLLYNFSGNCSIQIPLTASDRTRLLSGAMTGGAAGFATGGPIGAIVGAVGGAFMGGTSIDRAGGFSANAGCMGVKIPYIIVTRKYRYDAGGYNEFYGVPSNNTVMLGNCSGYTRVKSVHIESIPIATSDEKQQIETLLKQGVIIR